MSRFIHTARLLSNRIIGIAVMVLTACSIDMASAASYSDLNRELFLLPVSAALAGSDLVFLRTVTPRGAASNLPLDSTAEVVMSYANHMGAFSTSLLSLVKPINADLVAGVALSYLLVPNILVTTDLPVDQAGDPIYDPARIRYESTSDLFGSLSLGGRLLQKRTAVLTGGVTLNMERRSLLQAYRGYAMGLDASLSARHGKSGFAGTLACWNLLSTSMRWSRVYSEERRPVVGGSIGWRKELPYIYGSIQATYRTLDFFTGSEINSGGTYLSWDSPQDLQDTALDRPEVIYPSSRPIEFIGAGFWGLSYTFLNDLARRTGTEGAFALKSISLRGGLAGLRTISAGIGIETALYHSLVIGTDCSLTVSEIKATTATGSKKGFPDLYRASISCRW